MRARNIKPGLWKDEELAALPIELLSAAWVTFSDNVLDLLPVEERRIEVAGPVEELLVEGWNARA